MVILTKKEPCRHGCGSTLNEMATAIRKAIFSSDRKNQNPAYQRGWYIRESNKTLHPAVVQALDVSHPKDLHQLVLECPHISIEGKLAYTQNDEKGFKDIQTVTTVGRYLTRHFPSLPDHEIRGLAQQKIGCRIVKTMDEMQHALMNGPHSCMKWSTTENPYHSYCPTLGWGMAINEECGNIVGRALVHFPTMSFVRTYRKNGDQTTACETLQYWLDKAGFTKAYGWKEGIKLLYIDGQAPYLDGSNQNAKHNGTHWTIDDDGSYKLNNTDGSADSKDEDEYIGECECCGDDVYDNDDRLYAGRHDEDLICGCCADNFVSAYGQDEDQYNVRRDDCTEIQGRWYVDEYMYDQSELRCLENGDYAHEDDCFYCDVAGEYYLCYEETRVDLKDGDQAAECNAWKCSVSGDWYSHDEDFVEVDGEKVHPDNVIEPDEEEENESLEDDTGICPKLEAPAQRTGRTDADQLFADLVA